MEWFERWFGEEYLLVYEHRNHREAEQESEAIAEILHVAEHDLVLDLCCGPGRHDSSFARIGCRIIGLDYSMPLLKIATSAIPPGDTYPQYIRGDARRLPFREGVFDVVLNLFTSFGYFEDDENHDLLFSIARILKPGGSFFIDYLNPDKVVRELVPESTRHKEGMEIVEKRCIVPETKRVEKTIELHWDNNKQTFHESVRLYTREEMLGMLDEAGLETIEVIGSVNREPYTSDSDRMILHGVKR